MFYEVEKPFIPERLSARHIILLHSWFAFVCLYVCMYVIVVLLFSKVYGYCTLSVV
jgi:hypothetical protein